MKRLGFFIIGYILILPLEIAFAQRALCRLPRVVCATEMTSNNDAAGGMNDLLDILADAGINTAPLEEALAQNQFHQEGDNAGGILITGGGEGVEFSPSRRPYPYDGKLVLVNDSFTHVVLKEDAITDLANRNFVQTGSQLNNSALTAIHELTHAMIFRTQCFTGSPTREEVLVGAPNLESDIGTRLTIFLLSQAGNHSLALRLYDRLVEDITSKLTMNPLWRGCYAILGLPGSPPRPPSVSVPPWDSATTTGPPDTVFDTCDISSFSATAVPQTGNTDIQLRFNFSNHCGGSPFISFARAFYHKTTSVSVTSGTPVMAELTYFVSASGGRSDVGSSLHEFMISFDLTNQSTLPLPHINFVFEGRQGSQPQVTDTCTSVVGQSCQPNGHFAPGFHQLVIQGTANCNGGPEPCALTGLRTFVNLFTRSTNHSARGAQDFEVTISGLTISAAEP